MAQPKKQKSPRKTGMGRSHLVLKLARRVNGKSPVKVVTTKRETGKKVTGPTKAEKPTTSAAPKRVAKPKAK